MKYYSHYLWETESEKGPTPISIVLQQVKLRKSRCLLACVCDGTRSNENGSLVSGYVTERLVEWFHRKYLQALQIQMHNISLQHMLEEELVKIEGELQEFGNQKGIVAEYDVLGMAVWNDCFCCFWKGDCKGYVFNRRFNKKQMRSLKDITYGEDDNSQIQVVQGSLQKSVGVLLCSSLFDSNLKKEELLEVLSEESLEDEEIRKCLRELWKENQMRGEMGHAGAVFFRTE